MRGRFAFDSRIGGEDDLLDNSVLDPVQKALDTKLLGANSAQGRNRPVQNVIDAVELALGNIGVIALQLLLGAQLYAEVGKLALAALAVLAGTVFTFVDRGLRAAPDVFAETAVDLVFRGFALAHRIPFSKQHTRNLMVRVKETRPPLASVFET